MRRGWYNADAAVMLMPAMMDVLAMPAMMDVLAMPAM